MSRAARPLALALALAFAGVGVPAGAGARAAASAADSATAAWRPGRADAAFALGAAGAIAITAAHDREWSRSLSRDSSEATNHLATIGRQFGEPVPWAVALLSADALGRLTGHVALGEASERVALSGVVAGTVTLALKQVLGRNRPDVPPGDPHLFRPFSGDDAMPSAHATLAFAMASAVTAESDARWVPFVLYPAATLTAWSRVHDLRHWPSDVVAGAAIGTWVGGAVDRVAQRRLPHGLLVLVWPRARGAGASASVRF